MYAEVQIVISNDGQACAVASKQRGLSTEKRIVNGRVSGKL
jgi:hypothetical protein